MGKAFLHAHLERVVWRIGNRVLREYIAEHRDSIGWTPVSGNRIAVRGGKRANTYKIQSLSVERHSTWGWDRKKRDGIGWIRGNSWIQGNRKLVVLQKLPAGTLATEGEDVVRVMVRKGNDVQAGLGIGKIDVVGGQQTMGLRSYVTNLKKQILREFVLNCEIVLVRVLAAHVRLEFAEQKNVTKNRPVHVLTTLRSQDSIKRIGNRKSAALVLEGCIEESVKDERAASKRRFSAELFQHQLLDGIVEQAKTRAHAGFSRRPWTPCHSYFRSESLIVRLGQSVGHTLISGHE